jgi:chemotaxis protein CheX
MHNTTAEVFSSMVPGTVVFPENEKPEVAGGITGMVGIAGPLSATLSFRCSLESATWMASRMLGLELEEAEAERSDAVGEICNIVAGYFKANIGLGEKCVLSVPTVVVGTNYRICSKRKDLQMELPFFYDQDPVMVTLDIRT